ncbi:hypothetical protein CYMTET_43100 [Cymbomonas tetramitiformis]|uniref:Uncharacterized protein n=1 Tax=Cymbomonas tetramitiformis TaxID=36881 RepID=A0AAE0BUW8_9CHLO|nr:hypothetical protein CYMTET_47092 [Cymbomonas tetramitiformis]KAK3247402.1 hypothetical protein CYMTET_43100 [Cymbomonas tetramitiformis]
MWGLTHAHEETRGACPYQCLEAFAEGKVLPTTLPANAHPPAVALARKHATFNHLGMPLLEVPPPDDPVLQEPQPTLAAPEEALQPAAADHIFGCGIRT